MAQSHKLTIQFNDFHNLCIECTIPCNANVCAVHSVQTALVLSFASRTTVINLRFRKEAEPSSLNKTKSSSIGNYLSTGIIIIIVKFHRVLTTKCTTYVIIKLIIGSNRSHLTWLKPDHCAHCFLLFVNINIFASENSKKKL